MLALKKERLRRNWSLTDVTLKTGIAESNLSMIERQILPPYKGWQKRIARAFRMSAKDLFREVDNDTRR